MGKRQVHSSLEITAESPCELTVEFENGEKTTVAVDGVAVINR